MPRRQWGEEVGRGYELASTQGARWLHAKTRSGVEGPGAVPWPQWLYLSCKM